MKTYCVYKLIDPRDQSIHYIGITQNPARRRVDHERANGNSPREKWIRKLRSSGIIPKMVIIRRGLTGETAGKLERKLIANGHKRGWPLTNISDGGGGWWGDGVTPRPLAWRQHLSESLKGKLFSMTRRKHIGDALKGRAWGLGLKSGWHHTKAAKIKMSKAQLERRKK